MAEIENNIYISIAGLRDRIANRLLPLLVGSLWTVVAFSIWRMRVIGFTVSIVFQIVCGIAVTSLYTWRKHITPETISIMMLIVLYILFLQGVWSFGLMSASFILAPLISMYLTLLGYKKLMYFTNVFNLIYLCGVGYLHLSGVLRSPLFSSVYSQSPIAWVIVIVAVGLVTIAIVAPFELVPKTLERSEERFRLAFENANVGVCITGLDGRFLKVNHTICSMLGYSESELEGTNVSDVTHHDDLTPTNAFIQQSQKGGTPRINLEKRYIHKNGKTIWGNLASSLIVDSAGTPQYFITYIQDITGRKEAEEKLLASEAHYRSLVENSPDIIAEFDSECRFLFVNSSIKKVSNNQPENFIGKRMRDVGFSENQAREREDMIRKVFETQIPFETEFEFDGVIGIRIFDWRVYPFLGTDGNVRSVFSINRDITDHKRAEIALRKSEEKFNKIFHASPAPMVMSNLEDGTYIDVNESYLKQMEFMREEIIGRTSYQLNTWGDIRQRDKILQILRKSGSVRNFEIKHRTRAGIIKTSILSAEIIELDGKKCLLTSHVDITERKLAEEALQASIEEMHRLTTELEKIREEERKNISREVHDELGQLLTALHMDIVSLRKFSVPDKEQLETKLQSMLELTSSATKTVQSISARLRPGILDDLGLNAAIEWQTEDFQKRASIACEIYLPDQEIVIDNERSTALFRILQEALTNVARHARASAVKVSLSDSGERIVMSIKDNGIGITESQINDTRSYGLIGIRERLRPFEGTCEFVNDLPSGTEVIVKIPKETSSASLQ